MRITRLEAKGIGPFEDLNIEFKPKPAGMENKAEIHILTGENGTGKSTILMMLASCWDSSNDEKLKERFLTEFNSSFEILLLKEKKDYSGPQIELSTGEIKRVEKFSPFMNIDNVTFFSATTSRMINNIYDRFKILYCFFGYSGFRTTAGNGLVNIKEITLNPFENAVNFQRNIDSDIILDWVANLTTKELISKNRGNTKSHINAVQKIEKALSDITDKKIEFDLEETLKVSVKVNGVSLSFNTLPDGLKSIISWLSDLLMRLDRIDWADKTRSILDQNFILFLDEIEVHLHPSWQRKILPVVQDLFPNAQIFISTHSPFVVGSVDGARVYKFKLDENNNSVLEKEYLTEDGHSYQYYLRTGFDIESDFGLKNELDLKQFMLLKEKIIRGEEVNMDEFDEIVNRLENQTGELSSIVGFEKRKLEKYLATN